MGYISEKAMGNIVKKFLEQRDVYNLNNYKNAYNLRKWHNKEYNYNGDGVVNPAVLTIKKK